MPVSSTSTPRTRASYTLTPEATARPDAVRPDRSLLSLSVGLLAVAVRGAAVGPAGRLRGHGGDGGAVHD
eukprot:6297976-Pyramimonas_sp.AAC.2